MTLTFELSGKIHIYIYIYIDIFVGKMTIRQVFSKQIRLHELK